MLQKYGDSPRVASDHKFAHRWKWHHASIVTNNKLRPGQRSAEGKLHLVIIRTNLEKRLFDMFLDYVHLSVLLLYRIFGYAMIALASCSFCTSPLPPKLPFFS